MVRIFKMLLFSLVFTEIRAIIGLLTEFWCILNSPLQSSFLQILREILLGFRGTLLPVETAEQIGEAQFSYLDAGLTYTLYLQQPTNDKNLTSRIGQVIFIHFTYFMLFMWYMFSSSH